MIGVLMAAGATVELEFALDVDGLLDSDDFDRASLGSDWSQVRGSDVAIASNEVDCTSPAASTHQVVENTVVGDVSTVFIQITATQGNTNIDPRIVLKWDDSNAQGYMTSPTSSAARFHIKRFDSIASNTNIALPVLATTDGEAMEIQGYLAAGVQEAWARNVTDDVSQSASASDSTYTSAHAVGIAFTVAGSPNDAQIDDFIACATKNVAVSGLQSGTGQKAQIVNAGDSVVAEATESGGTATIDASRFGGATELVPFAGWPKLKIVTASDVPLGIWTRAQYPGHQITVQGLA